MGERLAFWERSIILLLIWTPRFVCSAFSFPKIDPNVIPIFDLNATEAYQRIKSGDLQKVGSSLEYLVTGLESANNTIAAAASMAGQDAAHIQSQAPAATQPARILVDIVGHSSAGLRKAVKHKVVSLVNCSKHVCTAYCQAEQLKSLASLDVVKFIRPVVPVTDVASVMNEGSRAMYANIARAQYAVNGTGIRIGVISNSFNCLGGADADIAAGVIPSNVVIAQDLTIDECNSLGGTDEGRAMIQIIHNVAPSAQIVFYSGFLGSINMAAGILLLAIDYHCNIIVDDISYLDQPLFQDGRLAQAADEVATKYGVPYFTSAGNANFKAWDAPNGFVDSGMTAPNGAKLHMFGKDSNGSPIVSIRVAVLNGVSTRINLYWDQPFWSVSGNSGGCTSDLDLYAVFKNGNLTPVAVTNNLGGDACETLVITPNLTNTKSSMVMVTLAIGLSAGPAPSKMTFLCPSCPQYAFVDYQKSYPAAFGIANSGYGAGVAAANVLMTPAFGVSPPQVESLSSPGGVPILFDVDGHRLAAPENRLQPRFTGPDGTATTFFGQSVDKVWRFFGTSAAAPHVAAVAALLFGTEKNMSPLQVYQTLQETAVNIGADGFDFFSGYGLINAENAMNLLETGSVAPSPQPSHRQTSPPTGQDGNKQSTKFQSASAAYKHLKAACSCTMYSLQCAETEASSIVPDAIQQKALKKYKNFIKKCQK